MRFLRWTWGVLGAAALFFSGGAGAQAIESSNDMNWTATAGRTVGAGNGVVQAEAGWPGIGLTYLHGYNELTDIGFHVGLNYGFEGTTNSATGLNLAVPFRRNVSPGDQFNIGLHVDPGLTIYSNNGKALVGVGGPVGVVAGYRIDPRLTLDVGVDIPILVSFTNPTGLLFGPLFGGGGEYLIDKDLAVTARVRVGPEFALASSGSGSQAAFQTLIGVAYNLR